MRRHELEHQFEYLMRDRTEWFVSVVIAIYNVAHICNTILPFIVNISSSEPSSAIQSLRHRFAAASSATTAASTVRNSSLMQMLERIDYQAATLAAKTEQLKLLKVELCASLSPLIVCT